MEEELLLKELDSILRPAIQSAYEANKDGLRHGIDIRPAMAKHFQMQIDNTKVALSEKFYDLNRRMNQNDCNEELMAQFINESQTLNETPEIDISQYVMELPMGYAVYDGMQWVEMSLSAQINLTTEPGKNADGSPIIRLQAFDPLNNQTVTYINDDNFYSYESQDLGGFTDDMFGLAGTSQQRVTYTDPSYDFVQKGIGLSGTVAGSLEAFKMGQHYNNYFEPVRNIFQNGNYAGGAGKWKTLDGQWRSFKEIQQAENAFQQGSLKTSANSARMRGSNAGKGFKVAGKVCFGVSAVFSVVDIYNAHMNNYSNKNEIYLKSSVDIVMGIIAFIPVYGWAVSGTYFLLDAGGAFGDWGEPSGFTQEFLDAESQKRSNLAKLKLYELDFEIDYQESTKEKMLRMQYEALQQQRDHTYYQPKVVYKNF